MTRSVRREQRAMGAFSARQGFGATAAEAFEQAAQALTAVITHRCRSK